MYFDACYAPAGRRFAIFCLADMTIIIGFRHQVDMVQNPLHKYRYNLPNVLPTCYLFFENGMR